MNKLFTFLFTSCLVALVLADYPEFDQLRATAREQCKKEQNVGDDVANILESRQLTPTNEAQQCFLECYYIKLEMIKDGKFNTPGCIAYGQSKFKVDKNNLAEAEAAFKSCESKVEKFSGEKCGIGKALRQCFIEHAYKFSVYPKSS